MNYLSVLGDLDFQLKKVTLLCSETALRQRMIQDGRSEEQINLSIERLSMYENMDTNFIDTSEIGTEEIVQRIKEIIS
jgi:hypothetical protein